MTHARPCQCPASSWASALSRPPLRLQADAAHRFTFDRVFDPDTDQLEIYQSTAKEAVASVLQVGLSGPQVPAAAGAEDSGSPVAHKTGLWQGYNASVIAYGQTGTGKTHTMDGSLHGDGRGVVPRAIEDIFESIQQDGAAHSKFLVRASYFQIYCEACQSPSLPSSWSSPRHTMREAGCRAAGHLGPAEARPGHAGRPGGSAARHVRRRALRVGGAQPTGGAVPVLSATLYQPSAGAAAAIARLPARPQVHQLMERGAANRTTGSTRMNEASSRSHAVFTIIVEKSALADETEVEQFILQSGAPLQSQASRVAEVRAEHGTQMRGGLAQACRAAQAARLTWSAPCGPAS